MITRDQLFEIINEWDPIGLIMMSAPYTEYAPEVDTILEHLDIRMTVEEIARLVDDTFDDYFNKHRPEVNIYESEWKHVCKVAEKIYRRMVSNDLH